MHSPGFYLTFWQLTTYDLSPPVARYQEEVTSLVAFEKDEEARRTTTNWHRDRRLKIEGFRDSLKAELKEQTASRAFTLKRLAREKNHWFPHGPYSYSSSLTYILIPSS